MHIVIAARIKHQRARLVAMSGPIGSSQIWHAVGHVGRRIEQAFRVAAIAKRPRGAKPDLHQTEIAAIGSPALGPPAARPRLPAAPVRSPPPANKAGSCAASTD